MHAWLHIFNNLSVHKRGRSKWFAKHQPGQFSFLLLLRQCPYWHLPRWQSTSDSTGQSTGNIGFTNIPYATTWDRIENKPATAMRWPSWSEVTGKPQTATRWPKWSEVREKPATFTPSSHNHDGRYVRKGASGSISGNLSVSGTVTGNRLVTGDVGGDRWCRANTSGRIQCTHAKPNASVRNVMGGWPLALNCAGNSSYGTDLLFPTSHSPRKQYVSLRTDNFIEYDSDGSFYSYRRGGRIQNACRVHIDDVPSGRKFL